ncbi:hypothetical protein BHE74_00019801, partial [Ensete ventricosum]
VGPKEAPPVAVIKVTTAKKAGSKEREGRRRTTNPQRAEAGRSPAPHAALDFPQNVLALSQRFSAMLRSSAAAAAVTIYLSPFAFACRPLSLSLFPFLISVERKEGRKGRSLSVAGGGEGRGGREEVVAVAAKKAKGFRPLRRHSSALEAFPRNPSIPTRTLFAARSAERETPPGYIILPSYKSTFCVSDKRFASLFQEEGWVVCRVFKKRLAAVRRVSDHNSPCWYDDHVSSFITDLNSAKQISPQPDMVYHQHHHLLPCKPELDVHYHLPHDSFLQLPQLESPKLPMYVSHATAFQSSIITEEELIQSSKQFEIISTYDNTGNIDQAKEQVTDWRVLDKFVASQLTHNDICREPNCSNSASDVQTSEKLDAASTSNSSGQVQLWK